MWEICTTHILLLFCVKRVPTLYISGFHPSVLLYHQRAWLTFHVPQSLTVTAIMVRNFTSSQHIWKISAPPILPSCELYSFLVLYILFFCFCFFLLLFLDENDIDGGGGIGWGGGVALKYIIPSIRFELDFYRILCRVFCFGEILPVVRDFCSLSFVSGMFCSTSLASNLLESREGNNSMAYSFGCTDEMKSWYTQRGKQLWHLLPLLISLFCGQHCPLVNMHWLSKACIQTVGLLFACCMSHCITPPYPAALLSQTVCWERNKYFMLDSMSRYLHF